MKRGDVILVRFPHPSGIRGKQRLAVVLQSDGYAGVVETVVAAEKTSNMSLKDDPACLFIAAASPEGVAAGLRKDSVVTCLILMTVYKDRVSRITGSLSASIMAKLEGCVQAAIRA